jgi:hypothetical protein
MLALRLVTLGIAASILANIGGGGVYRGGEHDVRCYYGVSWPMSQSSFGSISCVGGAVLSGLTVVAEFLLLIVLIRPGINSYVTYSSSTSYRLAVFAAFIMCLWLLLTVIIASGLGKTERSRAACEVQGCLSNGLTMRQCAGFSELHFACVWVCICKC